MGLKDRTCGKVQRDLVAPEINTRMGDTAIQESTLKGNRTHCILYVYSFKTAFNNNNKKKCFSL